MSMGQPPDKILLVKAMTSQVYPLQMNGHPCNTPVRAAACQRLAHEGWARAAYPLYNNQKRSLRNWKVRFGLWWMLGLDHWQNEKQG